MPRYLPPPHPPPESLPQWTASTEQSYQFGRYSDAPENEFEAALDFCNKIAVDPPRLLSSAIVSDIKARGAACWRLTRPEISRFKGQIFVPEPESEEGSSRGNVPTVTTVITTQECGDTCLFSNLPIIGGLYSVNSGQTGVYYEVKVHQMNGVIAIGMACKPYPEWRLPGWNRLSVGLHLDDMRKFFEDSDGGQDYPSFPNKVSSGDIIGCGYRFSTGEVFFTFNHQIYPPAFKGLFLPKGRHDVYAAIGVGSENLFEVNFGGEGFIWKPANTNEYSTHLHIGNLGDSSGDQDALPSYSDSRFTTRLWTVNGS